MQVLVVENHELPTVNVQPGLPRGRSQRPRRPSWVWPSLMASVWDEGTKRRSSVQIAEELAGIGASLSLGADWDSSAARLFTLKHHLPKALDVFGDVLRNPELSPRPN